jgi:hypothetical protein
MSDAPKVDVGAIIAELADLKKEKEAANKEIERIEKAQDQVKLRLRQALESLGLTEARNGSHSVAIVEKVLPQAENWEALYDYIHANKYYHLLWRRLSSTACEELFAQGIEIPGVEKFKKVDISMRSIG